MYLRESLSQIRFLLRQGDINESQAYQLFFAQPIIQSLMIADLETNMPVSLKIIIIYKNFIYRSFTFKCRKGAPWWTTRWTRIALLRRRRSLKMKQ